jgi:hypothetical protein
MAYPNWVLGAMHFFYLEGRHTKKKKILAEISICIKKSTFKFSFADKGAVN